jgi:hypothetical protein
MAETEECAQRACLRMAEVTVIHSVVTKATGSTAMGSDEVDMAENGEAAGERRESVCEMRQRLGDLEQVVFALFRFSAIAGRSPPGVIQGRM